MLSRWLSLGFMAFTLSACASAAVAPPSVSRDAIAREQAVQRDYVQAQGTTGPSEASPEDLSRLKAVGPRIQQAGAQVCESLGTNPRNCRYDITLVSEPKKQAQVPNAYADGKTIFITPAMLASLPRNEETAFVLAHEYAHNVLTHVDKKTMNAIIGMGVGTLADRLLAARGLDTGGRIAQLGSQYAANAYTVDYEREADYVGLYILEQAGYDVRNAEQVWRRIAVNNPDSIYVQSTHPTTAERYVAMQQTAQEIAMKKRENMPVLPNPAPE